MHEEVKILAYFK